LIESAALALLRQTSFIAGVADKDQGSTIHEDA
jgi:hypothetical protein